MPCVEASLLLSVLALLSSCPFPALQVNASGNVLYDSYVGQKEPVSDYRTWVSGITPANVVGAPDISTVQKEVTELLQGRVLVGHGLTKDLSVLMLSHPRKHIRDTAK